MPSLKGVVVHDGYSNLVWASEDWDLGDELDSVKDAISSALTDQAEFPAWFDWTPTGRSTPLPCAVSTSSCSAS